MPKKPVDISKILKTKDKTDITAILPKMQEFLSAILPIYTQATYENRQLLRTHNPTFNEIITMIEQSGMNI